VTDNLPLDTIDPSPSQRAPMDLHEADQRSAAPGLAAASGAAATSSSLEEAPAPARSVPRSALPSSKLDDEAAHDPLEGTAYRGLERLGRGSFGEVWIAVHRTLSHTVACKLLHTEHLDDPLLFERLRLEAEASARNAHPHLVRCDDLQKTPDGRPFIVMEHLTGRSLSELLIYKYGKGPLPLCMAVEAIRQTLNALGALHAAGVAHRDVKPSNIFVCREDPIFIKVLDLGLAKVFAEGAAEGSPRPLATPTATGVMQGTPRYMAPEQVAAEAIDHRADIYAVGALLHKLVTGCSPFADRKTWGDVMVATLQNEPDAPSSYLPEPLPEGLDALILKALEKQPKDRFQSASEMLEALDAIDLEEVPPSFTTRPIRPPTELFEPWLQPPKEVLSAPLPLLNALSARRSGVPPTVPMSPEVAQVAMAAVSTHRDRGNDADGPPPQAPTPPSQGFVPSPVLGGPALPPPLPPELLHVAPANQQSLPQERTLTWPQAVAILGSVALVCIMVAFLVLRWGGLL